MDPNSSEYRQSVLNEWKQVTDEIKRILSSVDVLQINTIPSKGNWSAAQIGQHLLKSYGVVEVLNGNVKPSHRVADEKSTEINDLFLNFTIKMKSPEAIVPTSEIINKDELITELKKRIDQITGIIINKDLTEICTDYSISEYGEFTRLEWINFNIVHSKRHLHQLKNTLASIISGSLNYKN